MINVIDTRTNRNYTFMQEYGLLQVSNVRHRADLQLGSLDLIAPTWPVALVLATITVQVGVVNTSISAYPLLSTYHLHL